MPPFHTTHPELSHGCSVFGILAQAPPPASRWRTCSSPAAAMSSICTHHLPASPYPTVSHGMPETEPQVLGFWDFGPTPTPGFALANVQPPRRLRVINLHPPPSSITLRRCFTRHTRNRATKARFSGFWPKPHNPASRWRMPSPAASTFSFTRTHHLPGLHHTTVL